MILARANELNIELNHNKRIDVIAQNSDKFITFSFGACQFKDSFAFLTASLVKFVRLNKYEGHQQINDWETRFRYTSTNPYIKSKTDLNLLTDKGVYPYDYMNSWDRFYETKLPKKDHFNSKLYEENITDKDYTRANIVWKHVNIKSLGEYHDLYLMTDVYLLTDVFESFRDMFLNYYGLDPAYYITLPNYSWNAFFSLTGVRLQQIHINQMYEMIEYGLRGGMPQCSSKQSYIFLISMSFSTKCFIQSSPLYKYGWHVLSILLTTFNIQPHGLCSPFIPLLELVVRHSKSP